MLFVAIIVVVVVESVPLSLRRRSESESPAQEVVRGLEKVVATTFLKLNRTVGAKNEDDRKLAEELENATHVVRNHRQAVDEAKRCVETRTNDARVARETFEKLVQQKNDLNASIADLKRTMELRNTAKKHFIEKVSDWKDDILDESTERLKILKASSEQLLKTIREKKSGSTENIKRPRDAPPVIANSDRNTARSTIGIVVSAGAGSPVTTRPKAVDTAFLQEEEEDVTTGEEDQEAQSFHGLYESIGELMRKYQDANGALPSDVQSKLQETASKATDSTVHQATLDSLISLHGNMDNELAAQEEAEKKANQDAETCKNDLTEAEPLLETAKQSEANAKRKRRESDEYYATHVLHFKQTIEFAQETLQSVEKRATEEFSGQEWDESLKKMHEEIKRTLDLCAKLEGKNDNDESSSSVDLQLVNMTHTAVRSVQSQTEVHAVAKTQTDEILKEETVVSS